MFIHETAEHLLVAGGLGGFSDSAGILASPTIFPVWSSASKRSGGLARGRSRRTSYDPASAEQKQRHDDDDRNRGSKPQAAPAEIPAARNAET
jgi:hypothetical protein